MKNVWKISTRANQLHAAWRASPLQARDNAPLSFKVLRDKVGFDKLKEKVVNPAYRKKRSCQNLPRMSTITSGQDHGFDDPENQIMEDFIRTWGRTGNPSLQEMNAKQAALHFSERKDMSQNMSKIEEEKYALREVLNES